jgi:hypothetical protein
MKTPSILPLFTTRVFSKVCLTIALSMLFATQSFAALTLVEKGKVITVTAQQLPKLNTHPFSVYSLVAIRNGAIEPIAYQFDEMTKDGFVYIDGANSLALTFEGVKSHIKGQEHFFDEDDELLFMFRDAGDKKPKNLPKVVEAFIAEIAIKADDGKSRYVYLVKGARLQSEANYVRYSSEIGRAETDFYSLKVDQKNALVWDEFYFEGYDGAHPRQPFDTMKMGMGGHVLPAGGIPVYLTNKSLKAKALAEKVGPIRATATYRLTLKFLGLPWFVNKLQIRHYEKQVRYDFIMRMPELRRQAMANLRVKMTMDGYDLDGADVVFSQRVNSVEKVDGKVSDIEAAMNGFELDKDQNNWIWLDSNHNFATFMAFELAHTTRINKSFNTPRVRYLYSDSKEDKQRQEFHKGQLPDAGFEVKMPQFGKVKMSFTYDMFDADITQDIEKFAKQVYSDPEVLVSAL